jgi:hypothetical protein
MKTPEQWVTHLCAQQNVTLNDILAIQQEAINTYKQQSYNPLNLERAQRIKERMGN